LATREALRVEGMVEKPKWVGASSCRVPGRGGCVGSWWDGGGGGCWLRETEEANVLLWQQDWQIHGAVVRVEVARCLEVRREREAMVDG